MSEEKLRNLTPESRDELTQKILEKYFDKKLYVIEEENMNIRNNQFFSIYYKQKFISDEESSECLYILIIHNERKIHLHHLRFVLPNICKINGAELLYLLYKVASELNYDIVIGTDHSKKQLYDQCYIKNLAVYNILLTGKSYYNRFGYGEVNDNEEIRQMKIKDFFDENDNDLKRLIELLNMEISEVNLTVESSVKDVIKVVDNVIRILEKTDSENDSAKEKLCSLSSLINKIVQNTITKKYIKYDSRDLLLDIDNPATIQIYNDLEKKLKITTQGGERMKRKKMKTRDQRGRKTKRHHNKIKKVDRQSKRNRRTQKEITPH